MKKTIVTEKPMIASDFAGRTCMEPGCGCGGELAMHAACHIGAATVTWWEPDTKTMRIECGECHKTVCRVKVAEK